MPIDRNLLKECPELVSASEEKRFTKEKDLVDKCISWYKLWSENKNLLDAARQEKNTINKLIGQKKKKKENADEEIRRSKLLTSEIQVKEQLTQYLDEVTKGEIHKIGNIIHESVPVSNDEENNLVVGTFTPEESSLGVDKSEAKNHHNLLYMIGGYEPERGVKTAGHRGYFLTGVAVTLSQALANYAMNFLQSKTYTKVIPPFFMTKESMSKVAELDDYDDQLYHLTTASAAKKEDTDQDKYLIATSEQPLCMYHVGEIINQKLLPIKYAGFSTNFRKEAGKHGKDTWGIFRVHQFDKVEQFCITEPEKSWEMHEEMRKVSEEFLQSLGLGYRVVNIVSGELNNAASKKYDIEAYFPGYDDFKELVSCSNCLDYQSRGLGIRFAKGKYVHMLNATLCAVTRTICCILENYQTAEGVKVPKVLQELMGTDFMPFIREPLKTKDAKK
eukprot:snap_masked-scaffold_21-processed-gene-5.78-mRNA-1 protein AED:0.01 eAED:0.01 QI:0/-1/0/1/-1/1/1/0/445